MTNEDEAVPEESTSASTPPQVTEAELRDVLRKSTDGANELNEKLREVFALSDTSATLRLR